MMELLLAFTAAVITGTGAISTGVIYFRFKNIRERDRKMNDMKKVSHIYEWETSNGSYGADIVAGGPLKANGHRHIFHYDSKREAKEVCRWLSSREDRRTYAQVLYDIEQRNKREEFVI